MLRCILCVCFVLHALFKLWIVIAIRLNESVQLPEKWLGSDRERPPRSPCVWGCCPYVVLRAEVKISSASFLCPLHMLPYSPPANPAQTPPSPSLPELGLIWYVQ